MQNAFVCGIVAALSFIGFVCILYFIMLYVYRPKGNSRYIVKIPSGTKRGDTEALVYGTFFKKLIFGDLIFDSVEFDKSELNDDEKIIVDMIIDEMRSYIKIDDAESDSEEEHERKP